MTISLLQPQKLPPANDGHVRDNLTADERLMRKAVVRCLKAQMAEVYGRLVGGMEVKGGPGSGNFGHEGRPGEVGGSGPGGAYEIGSHIGTDKGSVFAPGNQLPYSGLEGKTVPALGKDEIYVVRFSTTDETKAGEGVGHYAYAGKNLDDVIAATSAYTRTTHSDSGFLLIGKIKDNEWEASPEQEADGMEYNGVLGTEDAPVISVFPVGVRSGNKSFKSLKSHSPTSAIPTNTRQWDDMVMREVRPIWFGLFKKGGDKALQNIRRFPKHARKMAVLSWAEMRASERVAVVEKGGPGSGNFGHEGRPGLVGGSGPGGDGSDGVDKSNQIISDAMKEASESYSPLSPKEIAHGHCYEWAMSVHSKVPEAVVRDVDLWPLRGKSDLPYHVWIEYGGKAFDSETPNGVRSFRDLPFFKEHSNQSILSKIKPRDMPISNSTKGGPGSGNFGHEGRPGLVGGSGPGTGGDGEDGSGSMIESVIKDSIIKYDLINSKDEVGILIDKSGHVITVNQGKEHSVSYSEDDYKQVEGGISLHCHPNGAGFSDTDLYNAKRMNVAKSVVISSAGKIYQLEPPAAGWHSLSLKQLRNVMKEGAFRGWLEAESAIQRIGITREKANAVHWDVAMRYVANKTGIKYSSAVFSSLQTKSLKAAPSVVIPEWIEDPDVLDALEREMFKFAHSINQTTADDLRDELMAGMENGETINQLADRISGLSDEWVEGWRSEMIARTETARAFSTGHIEAWRSTGVVDRKVWVAAGDACPFCQQMDGTVVELDENFFDQGDEQTTDWRGQEVVMEHGYSDVNGPPLHPNCRCVLVAELSEEKMVSLKGGPGSGNFGHVGRIGQVGGSGARNGEIPIPPANEQRQYADRIRKMESLMNKMMMSGQGMPKGWKNTPSSLLANHGQFYEMDENTYAGLRGAQHGCYMNAGRLALDNSEYTYVEGKVSLGGIPIAHAWVINENNKVIDPTLRGGGEVSAYFGVPIKTEYLRNTVLRTEKWGVLDVTTNTKVYEDDPADFVAPMKIKKGGPGSGNFGHEGRPGEVGGSGPGEGGGIEEEFSAQVVREKYLLDSEKLKEKQALSEQRIKELLGQQEALKVEWRRAREAAGVKQGDNIPYYRNSEEYKTASKEIRELAETNRKEKEALDTAFKDSLKIPEGRRLVLKSYVPGSNKGFEKKINEYNSQVSEYVSGSLLDSDTSVTTVHLDKDARAFYQKTGAQITLGKPNIYTYAHEIGHHLEHNSPGIRSACHEFLQGRTSGKLISMREASGNESYRFDERTRVATGKKFINSYVGKVYNSGSTEVFSMGLEQLMRGPITFAKKDPAHFDLIVNGLRGKFRK